MTIEIHNIEKLAEHYKVFYTVYDGRSVSDINHPISIEALDRYIIDNELNLVNSYDWRLETLESDGVTQRYVCPAGYLEDNYFDVIKSYLEFNFSEVAA